MVELIVVIAILGLMLAIVIPMISTTDARKTEVKEYARSFYSNVQELMIDEKLANNPFPDGGTGTAKYLLICAEVNENNGDGYNGVKVHMSFAAAKPTAGNAVMFNNPDLLVDETDDDDKVVISSGYYKGYAEFATSLRKMLLTSERTGWYYAIVDSKYRVVSAYFVEGAESEFNALKGGKTFTDDYVIDNNYAGVWPAELAAKGKVVFSLPD